MKTTKKTIKGWATKTHYFAGQNVKDTSLFDKNFKEYEMNNLNGYKKLRSFETFEKRKKRDKILLHGVTERILIYGWIWRGAWNDPKKEIIYIYYK